MFVSRTAVTERVQNVTIYNTLLRITQAHPPASSTGDSRTVIVVVNRGAPRQRNRRPYIYLCLTASFRACPTASTRTDHVRRVKRVNTKYGGRGGWADDRKRIGRRRKNAKTYSSDSCRRQLVRLHTARRRRIRNHRHVLSWAKSTRRAHGPWTTVYGKPSVRKRRIFRSLDRPR